MDQDKQQRWTAGKKAEVILSLLKGEKTIVEVCRENDLTQSEVQKWQETFLKSGKEGLKSTAKDIHQEHQKELDRLQSTIGELYLELSARKKLQALLDQEEK